jgi:uncharacterized protein YjlB
MSLSHIQVVDVNLSGELQQFRPGFSLSLRAWLFRLFPLIFAFHHYYCQTHDWMVLKITG